MMVEEIATPATLDAQIALFLRVQRAVGTRGAYARELGIFASWLGRHVATATLDDLVRYQEYLRDDRHFAPGTQLRKLSTLRACYQFLVNQGVIARNPALGVRLPAKRVVRESRALSLEEIGALLHAIPRASVVGLRDHALFRLLLGNGARISEVCAARVGDLDTELGYPVLRLSTTKNGKPRRLVLKPATHAAILAYLATRGLVAGAEVSGDWRAAPLFLATSRAGRGQRVAPGPLSRRAALARFTHYGAIAGLDARLCHPHILRHTAITWALVAGADVASVRDMAGHSSLATTSAYAHSLDDLRDNAALHLPY